MADKVCKHPQGDVIPVVDFSRYEAKGPCVEAFKECPFWRATALIGPS
jgi:hypothetical protein